jgi:hypothetical protein
MLQWGPFSDFKAANTLLLWGDADGIGDLHGKLTALLWGEPKVFIGEGTSPGILTISIGGAGSELVIMPSREPESFEWRCSRPNLEDIVARVAALGATTAGHCYIDIECDYDVVEQVMISKGEYPFIQPARVAKRNV